MSRRGPDGEELAIDVARCGSDDAERVVVVASGTHGVEGFAGSMLQTHWLTTGAPRDLPDGDAVLLLHALNPWGFAWRRRVNEDGVDLNRNFVDFERLPSNPRYDELAADLVPEHWDLQAREEADGRLLSLLSERGMEAMQEAISGGQYSDPGGLFYGGSAPTWSHLAIRETLSEELASVPDVRVLDLHTGLGPFGKGELISSDPPGSAALRRARALLGEDVTSILGDDSVSASLTGEWLPRLSEWTTATVTAVALEFGTVDLLEILEALRADHWLWRHGDPESTEGEEIAARLRQVFAPDDPEWCELIWKRFSDVLGRALLSRAVPPDPG
ncbi:MAG: hypothetical protein JJLCMIEE_01629 [Acidimicrobiales bacterium]|nr:hypothetical protein [Acidimicrobiales bacterium]